MYNTRNNTYVKLSKVYRYPNSVLNPSYKEEDALAKASNDFIIDIKEVLNNYQNGEALNKLFETEIVNEPEFQRRIPGPEIKEKKNVLKINKGILINMLVNFAMEHHYKKRINFKDSPELFEVVPEVKDEEGNVVVEEILYLKEDVEAYFREQEDFYVWAIERAEQIKHVK